MTAQRDEVKALLERFRVRAPREARSLACEAVRSVLEGLSGERAPGDWLRSPGGLLAITGAASLFAAGFLVGRAMRSDGKALLRLSGAVAVGTVVGLCACRCFSRFRDEQDRAKSSLRLVSSEPT